MRRDIREAAGCSSGVLASGDRPRKAQLEGLELGDGRRRRSSDGPVVLRWQLWSYVDDMIYA